MSLKKILERYKEKEIDMTNWYRLSVDENIKKSDHPEADKKDCEKNIAEIKPQDSSKMSDM